MESKFQHKPSWDGSISWTNASFITITPLATVALMPYMFSHYGFSVWDFAIFSFMIFTTGISLTVGYHRLFSHQTFEVPALLRGLFLFFGAGCIENSALKWSSDHRYHHRFVDKDGDPYNINRGFFYAHMGWIFFSDPPERTLSNAPDLESDPLVAFQNKYYLPLCMLVGFGIPTFLGYLVGRPFAGFFWGGLFRVVLMHHFSFLINSACHMIGTRPYSTKVTARDCWWLAILTNGEGYHNFHHTFGSDYRNGVRWFHWDPSKWFIRSLELLGLASNVKRTPDATILKARMETSFTEFQTSWRQKEIPAQLLATRASLEEKLHEFHIKLREFQAWKESKVEEHRLVRLEKTRLWKSRLRNERLTLENSIAEFAVLIRSFEIQASAFA